MSKWMTRRYVSETEGGGAAAAPHWRDPLVHTGWMKGIKYAKSSRLKMDDPLIHGSGDKTDFVLWATKGTGDGTQAARKTSKPPPKFPPKHGPVRYRSERRMLDGWW